MKRALKKGKSIEKNIRNPDSCNSFLVETSYNSDIDSEIRNEIELKYSQSKTNSQYVFPRLKGHQKSRSKQITSKISLSKLAPAHKLTKSSISSGINDFRFLERLDFNKQMISMKLNELPKQTEKIALSKLRGGSHRQIKTERYYESKSPKNKVNLFEAYTKYAPSTLKKSYNNEIMNNIFTPIHVNSKILNSKSMRLKKIYLNLDGKRQVL